MKMKKVRALSLVMVLVISMLSACGKKADDVADGSQSRSDAMGRYLEKEIALPEEQIILDIRTLDDGTIGLLTYNEDGMTMWSSKDIGTMWEEQYRVPSDIEEEYIFDAALSGDKTMLCVIFSMGEAGVSAGRNVWKIDTEGNRHEINIDLPEVDLGERMTGMRDIVIGAGDEEEMTEEGSAPIENEEGTTEEDSSLIENEEGTTEEDSSLIEIDENAELIGDSNIFLGSVEDMQDEIMGVTVGANKEVLVQTMMGQLLQVDVETGEILRKYELGEHEYIMNHTIANGDVYIGLERGLQRYNLESGDSEKIAESLSTQVLRDTSSNSIHLQQGNYTLAAKPGEMDVIYLVDSTGIYRQSEDGTVLEQIIDAGLTSLGVPNTGINKMLVLEDDSFVVHVYDASGREFLYHYSYAADAKTTPETELSMYALVDNSEIRQAIAMYQKENPDLMISLQIGMTGEEGITVSDALNTLNTEIMAGNGPDIILLDGMPIDSYIERGILEDISDVVNQIDAEDGILEVAKNTHAIASRFSVPYVQGEERHVNRIEDIDTLGEVSKEIKRDNPNTNTINGSSVEELMRYLYQMNVTDFITGTGTLETEKMQNFLARAKEIAEDNREREESMDDSNDISIGIIAQGGIEGDDVMSVTMDVLMNPKTIGRGGIKSINDLAIVLEVSKKENMKHRLLTDEAGDTLLLANTILGINSRSERIEKAKEFLAFCLSKEAQKGDQGMGFPVNRAALNETLYKEIDGMAFAAATQNEEGVMITAELDVEQPEKADIETFETNILENTRIGYSNHIVQEIIMEQLMGYVEGQMTLEEAAEGINQRVSIYLAE